MLTELGELGVAILIGLRRGCCMGPAPKGTVDVEGTEIARRGRPPAQTAPGAAAAAAAAVRAASAPPRAASRAAASTRSVWDCCGLWVCGGVCRLLFFCAPCVPALPVHLVLMFWRVRRIRRSPSGRRACVPGSPFVIYYKVLQNCTVIIVLR